MLIVPVLNLRKLITLYTKYSQFEHLKPQSTKNIYLCSVLQFYYSIGKIQGIRMGASTNSYLGLTTEYGPRKGSVRTGNVGFGVTFSFAIQGYIKISSLVCI